MRAILAAALAALIAVPSVPAADAQVIYVDWVRGHFWAGLPLAGVGAADDGDPVPPLGVGPINLQRFSIGVEVCHRDILIDLLYAPANTTVDVPYVATLRFPYQFQVELFDEDGLVGRRVIIDPGDSAAKIRTNSTGEHRVDLYMVFGVDVDWSLRIRGFDTFEDETCGE